MDMQVSSDKLSESHGLAITRTSELLHASVSHVHGGKWFPIALFGFFAMQFVKDTEMKVHSHKAQLLYKTSISPFFFLVKGCWFRLVKKYSFNLKACHVLIC